MKETGSASNYFMLLAVASFPVLSAPIFMSLAVRKTILRTAHCKQRKNWNGETGNEVMLAVIGYILYVLLLQAYVATR